MEGKEYRELKKCLHWFFVTLGQSGFMKIFQFTAHIEKDSDTGQYIGIIPSVPGAHTYANTLDELKKNLQEVVELCLENMTEQEIKDIPEYIGTQQISVSV